MIQLRTCSRLLLAFFLTISSWGVQALAPLTRATNIPIHPENLCLTPSQINTWTPINNHIILIKSGERRYAMRFDNNCDAHSEPSAWMMSTAHPALLCGNSGEQAIMSSGAICPIKSLSLISQADYKALEANSKAK